MSAVLETHDLTGPITTRPACVRIAPDPGSAADLLHDESQMASAAVASVAEPSSVGELRQVLRWHADRGHAITVSEARTGLAGGAVPEPATHLVSVARLTGVTAIELDAAPPTISVRAGTTLRELQAEIASRAPGWTLPLDPTEAGASVGGMVATNAAGSRAYRFGATRDWVNGLTVELVSGRTLALRRGVDRADGDEATVLDAGGARTVHLGEIPKPRTKNAIGYGFVPGGDLVDLFIGSEGTLGIVSEVTFRLMPAGESRLMFLQCLGTPAQAFALVDAIRRDTSLRTTALEFLDARSHQLAGETGKPEVARVLAQAPPGSCSIFAEFGYDEAALEATIERVLVLVTAVGGDEAAGLAGVDDQVRRDIVAFRHAVPERINATIAHRRARHPGLHKIATDMAVEDRDLQWVYDLYSTTLTSAGLDHAIFGHVGNNHFHVNILPRDETELRRGKAIYAEFARALVARGGCVAAEHGVGRIKKHLLPVQYSEAVLDVMRAAKRWLDPEWRLNRGVLIDPVAGR